MFTWKWYNEDDDVNKTHDFRNNALFNHTYEDKHYGVISKMTELDCMCNMEWKNEICLKFYFDIVSIGNKIGCSQIWMRDNF
jgi:hypothetical protein